MRILFTRFLPVLAVGLIFPGLSHGQGSGLTESTGGLQAILDTVYNTMVAKCSALTGVAIDLAAIGTLCYICFLGWKHLSRNQPIDPFPLFRPFLIGLAISILPAVISLLNGVLEPISMGTAALADKSNQAITTLLQEREEALEKSNDWQMFVGPDGSGSLEKWEALSGEADSGVFSGLSNRVKFEMAKIGYNLKNSFRVWLSELLQLLFEAAALCINTVRTFYLIILALIAPIVFALSILDPFRHILANWFARYINVFLWLPIVNLFSGLISGIQQEMIKLDIQQLQSSGTTSFGPTDTVYLIFLLMGIAGYCCVPFIANQIIRPGYGLRQM